MLSTKLVRSPGRITARMAAVLAIVLVLLTVVRAEDAPKVVPKDRSESVANKLDLLSAAYAQHDYDLAMSLAESIKDTLGHERQILPPASVPQIAADVFKSVDELPKPWKLWSAGWSYYKPLTIEESIGIERIAEPIEVTVSFRDDQVTDLQRELRVVRIDGKGGTLVEIPGQLYGEVYRNGQRTCQVVFQVDVTANGHSDYLIFYGNPNAELPNYTTDLSTAGEGYALDITNRHFVANLSRQSGQLERLTYKRQHGLELYAGGKGHGEPPGIDWAHDYVDAGHFQKLRMRNWAECPNFEVVRGPLCVRVRRWGFPHSPLHPVFTPSRMHMDQTYCFYAGVPYFFKEGRFDVIKDMEIAAMRDDEWVFSGYSFTDKLWMDRDGKMHEGDVPKAQQEDLWGVGFYHRVSRDAFVAIRLDHSAKKFDGIQHGGEPTLQYDGHGQLWSRYPAQATKLPAGASIHQRNAYVVAPYAATDGGKYFERMRRQLLHPPKVASSRQIQVANVQATGSLASEGETDDMGAFKRRLWQVLRDVRDEQLYTIDANIVDLGYVYDLRVRDGVVEVLVTMPQRGRPMYEFLVTQGGGRVNDGIYERLKRVEGVRDVVVKFTWQPAWTVARLTAAGRKMLGVE